METLSPRERQVANLLTIGWSNKSVGMSLGISPRTVEDHRRKILRKCAVHNVVELTRLVYGITDETPNRFDLAEPLSLPGLNAEVSRGEYR